MSSRASRVGTIGNIIVFAILVLGAWLVWTNVKRGDAPANREDGAVGAVVREAGSALAGSRVAPRAGVIRAGNVSIGPNGLAIPVDGVRPEHLTDTFTAARGGGSRSHDAIDIMAPEGTPIVAAAPGTVEKLFNSVGKGGLTAYVRSDDGKWMYYYAHLSAYDGALREGQRINRGEPIGLVGHTGAASADSPHLHMAINSMNRGERWWQGTPINPYPLLAGKAPSR